MAVSYRYKGNQCDCEVVTQDNKEFPRDSSGQHFPFLNSDNIFMWVRVPFRSVVSVGKPRIKVLLFI